MASVSPASVAAPSTIPMSSQVARSAAAPLEDACDLRRSSPLQTLRWMLTLYGPIGTARLVLAKLRGQTGSHDAYAQWRDALLDRHLNIETASPVEVDDLGGRDDVRAHAVEYRPTSGVEAAAAIERLPIDPAAFHFLDLGCGKGRVVQLAAALPFATVTGVEFSPELADAARENLTRGRLRQRSGPCRILTGDARATDWPDGPLVVYLYNPFGREILTAVEQRLAASLIANPRPCYVLYANPQQRAVFETPDWDRGETGDDWWAVYRWRETP